MSEVMRWKLKGFLPGVEGESKAVFQPVVVLADDYDNAVRLFLDAAERCVAAERREQALQLLLDGICITLSNHAGRTSKMLRRQIGGLMICWQRLQTCGKARAR